MEDNVKSKHVLCPSCGSVFSDKTILKEYNLLFHMTSDKLIHIRICKSCGILYVEKEE